MNRQIECVGECANVLLNTNKYTEYNNDGDVADNFIYCVIVLPSNNLILGYIVSILKHLLLYEMHIIIYFIV